MPSEVPPFKTAGEALVAGLAKAVLDEPVLDDSYPIYGDYLYVADGRVVRSDWHGITARELKARLGVVELRRCDIAGRRRMAEQGAS